MNHHKLEETKDTWQIIKCEILDWILEQKKRTFMENW